jgi:hypothetical protein
MNKTGLLYCILIILTSCNNPNIIDKEEIETINLSELLNLKVSSKLLSDFASDFEYIRPEAKPGSYLSMIGISYIGPQFVILWEKRTSQLLAFHRDGKFMGGLGKKGPGPDEYLSLQEVFVLPNISEIHISDFKRNRILRYGYDLKLIGEVKINPVPATMHIYQNKYYLCAYSDKDLKENGGKDLIVRDPITLKELQVLWERNDKSLSQSADIDNIKKCWFFEKQDTLFYARQISSKINIYKLFNDKIVPVFTLNYDLPTNDASSIMPVFLNQIMFFQDYLLFGFQKDNQNYSGYYNLETKKLYNFEIINDLDKGLNFFPMGNCADGGYYSDDLKIQYFNEFWKSRQMNSSYTNLKCKYPARENWLKNTIPKSQEDNSWIMVIQQY